MAFTTAAGPPNFSYSFPTNVVLSLPPQQQLPHGHPPKVTVTGAPADDLGQVWTVVTGAAAHPVLHNPSHHPALVIDNLERDRINKEVQEAQLAIQRLLGSGAVNTWNQQYGYMSKLIPFTLSNPLAYWRMILKQYILHAWG